MRQLVRGGVVGAAVLLGTLGVAGGVDARASTSTQRVVLDVAVANSGPSPCRAFVDATGLTITSLQRDGVIVRPAISWLLYEDDPTPPQDSFTRLAHGQTAHVALRSVRDTSRPGAPQALRTTSWTGSGRGLASLWPVDRPGRYTAAVVLGTASGPRTPADQCGALEATVRFTVAAATSDRQGVPLWVVVVVAAGLVVIVAVVVVWLVVRRRSGPVVAGLVLVVTACLAASTLTSTSVQAAPGGTFGSTLTSCTASITAFEKGGGKDRPRVMPLVKGPGSHITIRPVGKGPGVISTTNGNKDHQDIWWAWWKEPKYVYKGDGVVRDPCASLYHELVHAKDFNDGTFVNRWCDDTGVPMADVKAILQENKYRKWRGLPPRTKFGYFGTMPTSMAACDKPPTKDWGPLPQGDTGDDCTTNCASSNGDPHLRTFDQRFYDFQAAGEFDALVSSQDSMRVQVRQEPYPGSGTVSVNTAVAMDVTGSRVEVRQSGGRWAVLVDGAPKRADSAPAGRGQVRQWTRNGSRAATVRWPDGTAVRVRPIGPWGLAVDVSLAASRRGKVTGLLGNDNGEAADDLATRDGRPVPDTFDAVHHRYADSWRIRAQDSLFTYAAGQNTTTFTDRAFPRARVDPARLPNRAAIETICRQLGITTPAVLDACVIDVALTGQASFADDALDTQATGAPAQTTPPGPATVVPGQTMHDGDTAGATLTAGGRHEYPLDLGPATVVRLVDLTGVADRVRIELVGPSSADSPGFTVTDAYTYRAATGRPYKLTVTAPAGASGRYGFRLITTKERRMPITLGQRIGAGKLDQPGRVDLYRIDPVATPTKIKLADGTPCDDVGVALVDDGRSPHAYTPSNPCWDIILGDLQPGRRYLLAVWSNTGRPTPYSFTLRPVP